MSNIQQANQAGVVSNFNKIHEGRVIDNKDPQGLGRVKVEILGKSDDAKPEDLPWLDLMLPLHLGASAYTANYAVPQINTQVVVMMVDDKTGYVIGSKLNRISNPTDPAELGEQYMHPVASERMFSDAWDAQAEKAQAFSPSMVEDYPYTWGWVDNAKNWFKVNMLKRAIEFVTNGLVKFKTYSNGDTVLHITGNFKIVIDKDFYLETRGNNDNITLGNQYNHISGNRITQIDGMEQRTASSDIYDTGANIFQN